MFLVLEDQPTEFGRRLKEAAEFQGLKAIMLTSAELVHDLALVFRVSEGVPFLRLRCKDWMIETDDIEGVYCSINTFSPALWSDFSPKDAEYAAQESHALWLAILAGLPCRVVNPPALDALAGTVLSSPEILYLAHRHGFRIPMVADVESGEVAAETLEMGAMARYSDLSELWDHRTIRRRVDLSELQGSRNHIRILEQIRGRPVWVTVIKGRFLPSKVDAGGRLIPIPDDELPGGIRSRLRALHSQLNLILAEYAFRVTADDEWVFEQCTRVPVRAVAAYGDLLFQRIVEAVIEEE